MRNQTSRLIDDAYSDYLNKMFSSDMPSNREFYRFIKSKKTENLGIPDLSSGTQTFSSDSEKAECLNNYFCSVFTKEDQNFVPLPKTAHPRMSNITVTCHGV